LGATARVTTLPAQQRNSRSRKIRVLANGQLEVERSTASAMPYPLRIQYPALSHTQLRQIGEQCGSDPVVHRLLCEIRALQNIARRAYQVAQAAGPGGRSDAFSIAVAALHRELEAETWFKEDLAEREAYRARLTEGPVTPDQRRKLRGTNKS
jgi:hypothetical protein